MDIINIKQLQFKIEDQVSDQVEIEFEDQMTDFFFFSEFGVINDLKDQLLHHLWIDANE